MGKVTSTQFFDVWVQTVHERKSHLLSIWRKNAEFTLNVKGSENSILKKVAQRLNLLCYEIDYYSIDSVFYKPEDLVPGIGPNSYWFRDLRVAFEHENNFKSGLYKEVSHLLLVECDLKVLVSYPNCAEDQERELNFLHKLICGNRHPEEISHQGSFLIILGVEKDFIWEGYIYNRWMESIICRYDTYRKC